MSRRTGRRFAADVGGTFTDILVAEEGRLRAMKLLSTPPAFGRAVVDGLVRLGADGVALEEITALLHGTTVATNAILERRGARTALVTTRGFRDVLEIGRLRRPSTFDISWEKPVPLVPRRLRFEVGERIDAQGDVLIPVDREEVIALAKRLRSEAVEAVAVCLLNSYVNPAHERLVAEVLTAELAGVPVSASYEILSEIREYERTSTTVVNAYIRPTVARYVEQLRTEIGALGVEPTLRIMQSNGGVFSAERAEVQPVRMVESGPAAGVIAAGLLARAAGLPNVLSFDMGGTTAKASLVEGGAPTEVPEYEVGEGMNSSRLVMGRGYTIRVPSIDIVEVGAGGGSLFWLDGIGEPHVGPRSAGAAPGPVCYGLGGTQVAVSDADLVLGYLNPEQLAGGSQVLDADAAHAALTDQAARPLGLSALDAAYGIFTLVNANMGRALRAVSIERGRDPRDFVLMAFGGAGPMHAVAMAREFEIPTVVVPCHPGLFSAMGLLLADGRHDAVRACPQRHEPDLATLNALFAELEQLGLDELLAEGYRPDAVVQQRFLDVCYAGQQYELRIPVPARPLGPGDLRQVRSDFDAEYLRTYGHNDPDLPVEIVNARVSTRGTNPGRTQELFELAARPPDVRAPDRQRRAYFGREHGTISTPVISRWSLSTTAWEGPLVIEDMDSTTVVPPGATARRDDLGNIVVAVVG